MARGNSFTALNWFFNSTVRLLTRIAEELGTATLGTPGRQRFNPFARVTRPYDAAVRAARGRVRGFRRQHRRAQQRAARASAQFQYYARVSQQPGISPQQRAAYAAQANYYHSQRAHYNRQATQAAQSMATAQGNLANAQAQQAAAHAATTTGMMGVVGALGAVAEAVGPFVALGIAVNSVIRAMNAFRGDVEQANQRLTFFNAQIAISQMQLRVGDIHRMIARGAMVETTAVNFAAAENHARDRENVWAALGQNAQNLAAQTMDYHVGNFAGNAGPIAQIGNKVIELLSNGVEANRKLNASFDKLLGDFVRDQIDHNKLLPDWINWILKQVVGPNQQNLQKDAKFLQNLMGAGPGQGNALARAAGAFANDPMAIGMLKAARNHMVPPNTHNL